MWLIFEFRYGLYYRTNYSSYSEVRHYILQHLEESYYLFHVHDSSVHVYRVWDYVNQETGVAQKVRKDDNDIVVEVYAETPLIPNDHRQIIPSQIYGGSGYIPDHLWDWSKLAGGDK